MGCDMSAAERERIRSLISNHDTIKRTIENLPNGVRTTTTTSKPELVETLRTHVREMAARLKANKPVRLWDPAYKAVFDHASEITVKVEDTRDGIAVTETTSNPKTVPVIQAHAQRVNQFVSEGLAAVAPPWAGCRR